MAVKCRFPGVNSWTRFVDILDALCAFNANNNDIARSFVEVSFDTYDFTCEIKTGQHILYYSDKLYIASPAVSGQTSDGIRDWEALRKSYRTSKITVRRAIHHATLLEIAKAFAEA